MRLDGVSSSTSANFPSNNVTDTTISRGNVGEKTIENNQRSLDEHKLKTSEEKKYSEEEVLEIIEQANDEFVLYDKRFEFSIHEKTKKIMVKVLDSKTDEVIRELPPEKVLDMVAGIWEVAGIIVDKKV